MIACAAVFLAFWIGFGMGVTVIWKNFQRDQVWIKKEIKHMKTECDQVDRLIEAMQKWMAEIDLIIGE